MARIYNDVPQMWKRIRLFFFNGSMDLNLENLCVDLYYKNSQSCITEVETFKLFFSNGWMACFSHQICVYICSKWKCNLNV